MTERLTQEELFRRAAAAVSYDPETGVLTWLPKPGDSRGAKIWNPRLAGKEAGTVTAQGYRKLCFEFKEPRGNCSLMAHRLAWFIVHGVMPNGEVDHINRDRLDNRIANLRDVPAAINQRNAKLRRDNTSGISGVYWVKRDRVWKAFSGLNGAKIYLGVFREKEAAAAVVREFRATHGYTSTHGAEATSDAH